MKDKIKVLDTLFTNNRIDKVLLSSSNLTNKRNTENVLYMDCPLQLYDFIQVNLKLKDFNNLNGTINVYDTSQFKFSVNGKINKGFRFMGDTIKHILFANKRYFFKVSYIKAPNDSFVSDMVDTFLLNHTNTITLNFRNVNLKKIKDTSATVTLNFPNKFFTKPVITLDKGEKINLVSINNKSLKLLLPLDKTFNIYVKEGNHLGYAKVTTNTGLIDKDFICQSLAYEIRFKLSNKLRHLQQSIAVKRKSGEVNVKFDKDFCIVKFYNANKADGFEQIDLTLPHDNLRICCFKGKLTAGQVKEWNCGEFCRACEEKTKTQAAVKQKAKK